MRLLRAPQHPCGANTRIERQFGGKTDASLRQIGSYSRGGRLAAISVRCGGAVRCRQHWVRRFRVETALGTADRRRAGTSTGRRRLNVSFEWRLRRRLRPGDCDDGDCDDCDCGDCGSGDYSAVRRLPQWRLRQWRRSDICGSFPLRVRTVRRAPPAGASLCAVRALGGAPRGARPTNTTA